MLLAGCVGALLLGLAYTGGVSTLGPFGPFRSTARVLTGATLGGTLAAFDDLYGGPSTATPDLTEVVWDTVTIAGQQASLSLALDKSRDGHLHVISISVGPAIIGVTWDSQTAVRVMTTMFPSDYHFVKTSTSVPNGVEQIYNSASLSVTLTRDQFTNSEHTPGPTDEFSIAYLSVDTGRQGQINLCLLQAGEGIN